MKKKLESKKNSSSCNNKDFIVFALKNHKTHKNSNITFIKRPYLKEIYQCQAKHMVMMKSTQCGVSEYLIARLFYNSYKGLSTFYVLPTIISKNTFVANRIDKSISYSKGYNSHHKSSSIAKMSDTKTLKHIYNGSTKFVGSNSDADFKEYPADELIFDELDQCDINNVKEAYGRLDASDIRNTVKVANPTVDQFGIHAEFLRSTQQKWMVKHDCGHWIDFDFFKHVVERVGNDYVILDPTFEWGMDRDINIICDKCHKPVNRYAEGIYVPANKESTTIGFSINKIFSSQKSIKDMVADFDHGLSNDAMMQKFYNNDLGVPYTSSGAKIGLPIVNGAMTQYPEFKGASTNYIGVDVGTVCHCVVLKLYQNKLYLIKAEAVPELDDVKDLCRSYFVKGGTIDAHPETRMSRKFASWNMRFYMCDYREVTQERINYKDKIMLVDRTQAMDMVKEYLLSDRLKLPPNVHSITDFTKHLINPTKVFDILAQKYRYTKTEDHFYHATIYALMAVKLCKII